MPRQRTPVSSQHTPWNLPVADLDDGVKHASQDFAVLGGTRVLVTGGTGFIGSWLVASLLRANTVLGLDLRLTLLTRNPRMVPLIEGPTLTLLEGDVRSFSNPGPVDVIIHGAATSSSTYGIGDGDPRRMAATIVEGTQAVLDIAIKNGARVLFLSSGAVYGPQISAVSEDCATAPESMDARSAYAQAKRLAETLCVAATEIGEVSAVVARLFAFVGPRIPLEAHFAAGNFLRDAVQGQTITIRGDGRPRRSYLYTGDLPEWCWAILARGRSGVAYNVGSPDPITIEDLAHHIAKIPSPSVRVEVMAKRASGPAPWYVPITSRSENELGLISRTDLVTSLRKTYSWITSGNQI